MTRLKLRKTTLFFCSMFKQMPCVKSITVVVSHSRNRDIKEKKKKKRRKEKRLKGKGEGKGLEVIFYGIFSSLKCVGSGLIWNRHCVQDI